MKNNILYILLLLIAITYGCKGLKNPEIKVMSFNIWMGGGHSIEKTAEVIANSNADIIGIQESLNGECNTAVSIANSLGWYSYSKGGSETTLCRYAIVDTSSIGYGVKIQLDKRHYVWTFNVHLFFWPYQPYQLNGVEYGDAPMLNTAKEAIASAWKARKAQVTDVITDIRDVQDEGWPIFLTGDFNEPSFLDWTERAVEAGLCKLPVQWPAEKAFIEQVGMRDSYRLLFSDEVANPGHTWTSCPSEHEVLDRIDFVLFKGGVIPVKSEIIGEEGNFSNIQFSGYPSDHRAVITTFRWK
ncbi:MAG: endonuclease/exonuclease/phosphatase family protein [Prevotella sp.]|jgi:endonuclease/exonuclease/phosphatase family metal-dependent hydrolase|nr:endonuclease/exonuclease/phosphatase family protein [Prevotella sp.]MDR2001423.1 endonuclease/exonuclease/phosphatase family protein [Prevotella sp.]